MTNDWMVFVTAFAISAVIAGVVCLLLWLRMRSVAKQTRADRYTVGALKLTAERDRYTHTTHTRRKIEEQKPD